ncbi:hypothetical protein FGU71_11175 [Erythrobacter insulae]|uniref:Uncharacterized protein n=2 Tax=Erythrobacter insulae TaxID=2584124 RepID=A0A547PFB5_9SPHN|nr:hypothetical protein FGU71_11175 [Erythrobacter insulae]
MGLGAAAAIAGPVAAKDSLGVYSNWAAFRDAETPRCYAIAKPRGTAKNGSFASIGTWPDQNIRNQVYFRLSRAAQANASLRVRIGTTNFELVAQGRNAWAADRQTDAAIVAALRSASAMRVSGGGISDRYDLSGVATAMDAAIVGCAEL